MELAAGLFQLKEEQTTAKGRAQMEPGGVPESRSSKWFQFSGQRTRKARTEQTELCLCWCSAEPDQYKYARKLPKAG